MVCVSYAIVACVGSRRTALVEVDAAVPPLGAVVVVVAPAVVVMVLDACIGTATASVVEKLLTRLRSSEAPELLGLL